MMLEPFDPRFVTFGAGQSAQTAMTKTATTTMFFQYFCTALAYRHCTMMQRDRGRPSDRPGRFLLANRIGDHRPRDHETRLGAATTREPALPSIPPTLQRCTSWRASQE